MKILKNMTHPLCASSQGNVINFKQSCLNNLGQEYVLFYSCDSGHNFH